MPKTRYCTFEDPEWVCTAANPHVVCYRKHGGTTIDAFCAVRRESKAVDYFWETGDVEVFDAQKREATAARRDRVTRVEHVLHD